MFEPVKVSFGIEEFLSGPLNDGGLELGSITEYELEVNNLIIG